MKKRLHRGLGPFLWLIAGLLATSMSCAAQQPEGPQSAAPPPVAPAPKSAAPQIGSGDRFLRERESALSFRTVSLRATRSRETRFTFKRLFRSPRAIAS